MDNDTSLPKGFSLGHPDIDAQHAVLFAIYDQIGHILGNPSENFAMDFIFSGLRTYARTHFKFEEILMDRVNHLDRTLHANEHRRLENQVADIAERFSAARNDEERRRVAKETQAFIYHWLTEHIVARDRKLCEDLGVHANT
ncbi:MAG: hemerythrin family protein [Magnetococcus sp. DMHC-1]